MKTLNIIYCSRVGFGVIAALMCILLRIDTFPNPIVNGMTIGILVYLLSYYILKWLFMAKVEKTTKVFTMGIGAYFLTWIVAWVVFYTLIFH